MISTGPCRAVLDLAHRSLVQPAADQPEAPALLADLVKAFGASSAGLARLPDGQPRFVHPASAPAIAWPIEPSWLEQARHAPGAAGACEGEGRRLLTTLTTPTGAAWVLWVKDDHRDNWTDDDLAALALFGAAVARRLDAEAAPGWAERLDRAARQERLEVAAALTRRLAHDFGNVLTGILGFTELSLAQQVPANTPLASYLQEVYRAAQSGSQFTHQLRLFSRRQSASSRGSPLGSVLAEQEARLFAASPASGVNLRLNVPADLPRVGLDPEHLHHVLTALLDNAREALVGPGAISVSARVVELDEAGCRELYGAARPGPHVEIVIADTGLGLSPEVQRRLFAEPFYSTKPRRRGFGLAIAYGILHAHGGGLRLHAGEERGVVARVVVPVAPAVASVPEEIVRPSDRLRGDRLLVVDDEVEVLQFVRAILERAGYRVEAFDSAESALEAYAAAGADPFRLVVSDVVMPGLTGVDLARRLLRKDPQARVLFMSGHVSGDISQPDLANHAFELLAKPFRTEQLLKAVQNNLERAGRPRPSAPGVAKK